LDLSDPIPSTAPSLTHHVSTSPLVPRPSPYGPIIPIVAYVSRAGPDHYMVEHVDDNHVIRENVLVQDSKWLGPLAVAAFVAFNGSQLVVKCLGRNGAGDVIERYLVVKKLHCLVPISLMQETGGRKMLVSGLSEREYMTRSAPGPVLPFPHCPLPFPLQFPRPSQAFVYEPLFYPDEDVVGLSSCLCLSKLFSSLHSYF
jgi:hypothetical protein